MFVALRTETRDGHDFLPAAAAAGAAAALVSTLRPDVDLPQLVVPHTLTAFQVIAREHRRNFPGPVAGISGSAGKTSTKDLLALLLGERALATEGNLNNHLGVPLTLTRLDPERHGYAIIEAGISGPDEMKPLAEMIEPDVAVITLVDRAHTAGLGDIDGVAREKALLPAAARETGVAILPDVVANLPAFQALPVRRLKVERADVIRPEPAARDTIYYAVSHRDARTGVSVAPVNDDAAPELYEFRRVSDGMTQNAVLAICVARWLGVEPAKIRERLIGWGAAPLRGEVRRDRGRLVYVDCYNANPAAMADALQVFKELTTDATARLYVLGGMEELGAESEAQHLGLGASLALGPHDRVLAIGTGNAAVREGARLQGASPDQIEIFDATEQIGHRMDDWTGPIFIKGSRRYHLETLLEESAVALH